MINLDVTPQRAAYLLLMAARNAGRALEFNPDQPRDEGGQWTSGGGSSSRAPDLGEHDLPSFDQKDADSPEWKTILRHDQFLDDLDESDGDEDREAMKAAVDAYVHDPDNLNAALRTDPDLIDEADEDDEGNDDDEDDDYRPRGMSLAKTASELENAMADAPKLKEPVTVYRGLRDVDVEEFTKNSRVTLNGFQSTSFDPEVAASFMGEKSGGMTTGQGLRGILLKIEAKYGLAFGHAHSIGGEMEMLLPHGDSYDILGVSRVRYKGGVHPMVHLRQR